MKKITAIYLMVIGASLSLTSCNNAAGKKEDAISKQMEIKRVNDSLKLDSFKRAEAAKAALIEEKKTLNQSYPASKESNVVHSGSTQHTAQPIQQNTTEQKKGWSSAAKGTAIGAGAGAGVGALIDKNKRGRGAIIGAAIGGGSGYAIGRKKDKENGRVQKK